MTIITPLQPHPHTAIDTSIENTLFGDDGLNIDDVIDTINPLQHIPFISHIYREATGDAVSIGAHMIGGGVFGGVTGAATSFMSAIVEEVSGQTIIQSAIDAFDNEHSPHTQHPSINVQALEADGGEALLSLIQSGAFNHDTQSSDNANVSSITATLTLTEMTDGAMGLTDANKQRQLSAHMHKKLSELA